MLSWRLSGRSGGDGPRAIGNPFAPRAGVEPPGREAGELHGERIVACRHARAAHVHGVFGLASEQLAELRAQLLRRLEAPVRIQVLLPEAVDGAGNVAGDGIDGLHEALETLGGTRVEQLDRGILAETLDEGQVDGPAEMRLRLERALARRRHVLRDRTAFLLPERITAVEEGGVLMAEPAQHPPQAHGEIAAE